MDVRASRVRVEALRGDHVESSHDVYVAAIDAPHDAAWATTLDALPRTNMRSTGKPFQLLPLVARGDAERLGLGAADLALLCSSHHGTSEHAMRVERVLERLGRRADDLRCGLHRPYFLDACTPTDPAHTRTYGPLHHNCSGNHAALLALACAYGDDVARYLDPGGRAPRAIQALLESLAGEAADVLEDNCGAPCYDLPLGTIARLYGFLARPARVRALGEERRARVQAQFPLDACEDALQRVAVALAQAPEWASSETSAATLLARGVPAGLVVKHGGEGMLCVAHMESGAALALKVADGSGRAAIPALVFLMRRFGWLEPRILAALEAHREMQLFGHRGHAIGRLRAVAPA